MSLLEFERQIRGCKSARELRFVAVNEAVRLLHYDQAVLWQRDRIGHVNIANVSGLTDVDSNAPYSHWLQGLFRHLQGEHAEKVAILSVDDLPQELAADAEEWSPKHLLHCPLTGPEGALYAGLLFSRADPFSEQEQAIAEWAAGAVGFAMWAWRKSDLQFGNFMRGARSRKVVVAVVAVLLILGMVPVRMNALAPGEITPLRPIPITSPSDGVVRQVMIEPNQAVKSGDVLVELDDTTTRNRLAVAAKSLEITRADLQRATNKAFSDEASRGELQLLDARVKERSAEVAYLSELLQRLQLTAPQDGIAIFADAEAWTGKPVQTGEKIMILANPAEVALTIYVPPDDAIQLESGGDVQLFLNIAPLVSIDASIVQTSYEAVPTAEGALAYMVRAELKNVAVPPRIGLKGTAKVYAEHVPLGYYLLRKPVVFLRRSLGI